MPETTVKYLGTTRKDNPSDAVVIDGVEFRKGKETTVDNDDLVAELREGSDRLKGFKFEVGEQSEPKPSEPPDQAPNGR